MFIALPQNKLCGESAIRCQPANQTRVGQKKVSLIFFAITLSTAGQFS